MVTEMGRSSKKSSGDQVGASPLEGVMLGWSGAGEADKVWVVACVHVGVCLGLKRAWGWRKLDAWVLGREEPG